MPSASAATCSVWRHVHVVLRRHVQHARAPHILEQRRHRVRRAAARRRRPRAGPPRWSRARRSRRPRARLCTTSAPARIRSARAGLMPGTLARSAAGSAASRSTSSSSASRSMTMPCTPLDGRPAAAARRRRGCAPSRRCRPDVRRAGAAGAAQPLAPASSPRDVLAQLLQLLALGGPVGRQEALAHAHRAQRARSPSSRARRSATCTSCIEPPPRSSTQPSLSVVELTAAR